VIAAHVAQNERAHPGQQRSLAKREIARPVIEELVSASLGLDPERERGIGADVDTFDRIHLDRDGERHDFS
jgi:hypothetical protein